MPRNSQQDLHPVGELVVYPVLHNATWSSSTSCIKCHRKAWKLEEHRVRDDGYVDFYRCTVCDNRDAVMSWGYSNRHDNEGPLQREGLV